MGFSNWDGLFNLLLLVFWIRVCAAETRDAVFNPYLATANRLSGAVLHFLRPAFFMLPERAVALIAMLLLIVLRACLAPRADAGWVVHLGFEWRQAQTAGIATFLAFSLVSFAVFLFKVWGVSLLFIRDGAARTTDHTLQTIVAISRPFVNLPYALRPPVLLGAGVVLALVLNHVGHVSTHNPYLRPAALALLSQAPDITLLGRAVVSALSGWVEVLGALIQLVVALIIASWIAMFTAAPGLSQACREWIDLLMGPMRRHPLHIGSFDLTPVVFILVVGAVQGVLQAVLLHGYMRVLGAG